MIFLDEKEIKNSKILIIDDEPINLSIASEQLSFDGYQNLTTFINPLEAVEAYKSTDFDLVLLDINMPELDGFAVMEKFSDIDKSLPPPVLILTALIDKKTLNKALKGGARDFLQKPFDEEEILSRVRNLLEMHLAQKIISNYNKNLERVVQKRTQDLLDTQLEIIQRLSFAAEYRDTETADHTVRVGEYSRILGEELGITGQALSDLHHAAPMHDIGKIGIRDDILLKPGKYTPDERKEMEKHTLIGAKILEGETSSLMKTAQEIALNHHECWNGTGYPQGLSGEGIPITGRIVMVADVFDALTMIRPYKKAWTTKDAVSFIEKHSGLMFDPNVVNAFKDRLTDILSLKEDTASE